MFTRSTDSETTELAINSLHPFYTYTFVIVPVTVDMGTKHTRITIRTEETGIAIILTSVVESWIPLGAQNLL